MLKFYVMEKKPFYLSSFKPTLKNNQKMKKFLIWTLAIIITLAAAYYQRKTGPTKPKRAEIMLNDKIYELELVRSIEIGDRSEVKLHIYDTTIKARLFYKIYKSQEEYSTADFEYKVYPVDSYVMNKIFKMTQEDGFFAPVPEQPAAGKLQYFIELTDGTGTKRLMEETPVVIRYKGAVPGSILAPHILLMFIAMLFSTAAGLLALFKMPSYRKTAIWTLILFAAGGMILGPIVQKYAFGDLWTGIPYGWDLTDNKTLIAFIFWILAVVMSWKKDRPAYTILASVILMLVYSIPHSMFGSELDYATGQVTQGIILAFFLKKEKNS